MEKKINKEVGGYSSLALDSLRIYAAFMVLFYHVIDHWFNAVTRAYNLEYFAHSAVIIFFVLSGYLIAFTTTKNNRGGIQYMQARLSRLYSVVLPALFITAICETVVGHFSQELFSIYSRSPSWPRYIISGFFLNELWFYSSAPQINGPLWSLGYEFWYYLIFGLWFYRKKGYKALVLPLFACLIIGPKVLSLMPIWLMGYFAYKLPTPAIKNTYKWIFMLVSLGISISLIFFNNGLPFKLGSKPMYYASQFISDWTSGLFIGLAVWIMPSGTNISKSLRINLIRKLADLTFAIYVLHYPLLIVWDSLFYHKIKVVTQVWEPLLAVLTTSILIGILLERKKYLWKNLFKYIFSQLDNMLTFNINILRRSKNLIGK